MKCKPELIIVLLIFSLFFAGCSENENESNTEIASNPFGDLIPQPSVGQVTKFKQTAVFEDSIEEIITIEITEVTSSYWKVSTISNNSPDIKFTNQNFYTVNDGKCFVTRTILTIVDGSYSDTIDITNSPGRRCHVKASEMPFTKAINTSYTESGEPLLSTKLSYTFIGNEKIQVEAGTFQTEKLSHIQTLNGIQGDESLFLEKTLWRNDAIGMIRSESKLFSNSIITTTELLSFSGF